MHISFLVFSFYPFFERLVSFATRWLFMPSVTLPKPCAGGGRLFRRTYFPINRTLCAPDLYIFKYLIKVFTQ